ncbi:glycosyltransferase family 2 protein [Sinomicrobium sp. M5D2P17]
MENKKVAAVVVTFNRLALLKEVVGALLVSDRKLEKVIVVNNASTDDTHDYLTKKSQENPLVEELLLKENSGGAGGFYHGIKYASEQGYDYMWLMDDDSIVTPTALDKLLGPFEDIENLGFSCSKVVWTDGNLHKMNIPEKSDVQDDVKNYESVISCSFVSMLIPNKVVKEVGYPYKDFFIWCDDMEYSWRITRTGYKAVLANDSVVIHKTASNYNASLSDCPEKEFWKYKYGYRNRVFTYRKHKEYGKIIRFFIGANYRAFSRKTNKMEALKLVWGSMSRGFQFNPEQ